MDPYAAAAERVLAASGAEVAIWFVALPDGEGLEVATVRGDAEAAQWLAEAELRIALGHAFRAGEETVLALDGAQPVAYAQPVLSGGESIGVLVLAWRSPPEAITASARLAARLVAGEVSLGLARSEVERGARRRRAFELNDGVLQGLVVAKYALEAGRAELALDAVSGALERSRELVSAELADDVRPGSLARERAALDD